jgi:hypothetical protein
MVASGSRTMIRWFFIQLYRLFPSILQAFTIIQWVAGQITEAFPWNEAPRYMIRDRDRIWQRRHAPIACAKSPRRSSRR